VLVLVCGAFAVVGAAGDRRPGSESGDIRIGWHDGQ